MTLKYKNSSILKADERVIAQGCNAKGKMGAGVALAIAERWPRVKQAYEYAVASGALFPGFVNWVELNDERVVANVITQQNIGKDPNVRYASFDAIDRGLRSVVTEGRERGFINPGDSVAIPAIGSGLGNAPWQVVRSILEIISDDLGVDFVIYETNPDKFKALQE